MVLDFLLQPVVDEVSGFKVADAGFGLLMDSSRRVLSFPDSQYVGRRIDEIPGFEGLGKQLKGLGGNILTGRYMLNGV